MTQNYHVFDDVALIKLYIRGFIVNLGFSKSRHPATILNTTIYITGLSPKCEALIPEQSNKFFLSLFFLQIHKLSMIYQASGNSVSIHIQHTDKYTQSVVPHTHTLTQCGSGRVCCHGSLLLQWCSGATLQPHTAPNVPALLLASRSHMGKEQPIWWEEHFVWIESLSALRTKEERCSDGKSLVRISFPTSLLKKKKKKRVSPL